MHSINGMMSRMRYDYIMYEYSIHRYMQYWYC